MEIAGIRNVELAFLLVLSSVVSACSASSSGGEVENTPGLGGNGASTGNATGGSWSAGGSSAGGSINIGGSTNAGGSIGSGGSGNTGGCSAPPSSACSGTNADCEDG